MENKEEAKELVEQPTPLTIEILDRCKWLRRTTKDGEPSYFNGANILIRIADWSLFLHSEVDGSVHWVKYLRSLQDLQNIYQAIENTELTIEPPLNPQTK